MMNKRIKKIERQNLFLMIKNKKNFQNKNPNKNHKLQFKASRAHLKVKKNKKNQKKKNRRIKRKENKLKMRKKTNRN